MATTSLVLFASASALLALAAAAGMAEPATPATPAGSTGPAPGGPPNAGLTPAQIAAGWQSLFDGTTPAHWRGYRKAEFPSQGWTVQDGWLKSTASGGKGGGGDIITREQYGDFEFALQWKATTKGNSGIMYRVTEKHDATWQTGPEFQVLDDPAWNQQPDSNHASGALYDLEKPTPPEGFTKTLNPVGEVNSARILLHQGRLKHWLNGVRMVDTRIDTPEWTAKIAASKFKVYDGFGVQPRGHIAIQDHGDTMFFKGMMVRDPGAPMPGQVALFNGKDLAGWKAFVPDAAKASIAPESVWSAKDGVLVCAGKPTGYIRTEKPYTNFVLRLEWRWPEGKQPGNSGVLVRVQEPDAVWPKSVEAQLQSGSAGDFWNIGDFQMATDPARTKGRNTRKLLAAENPVGQWNRYEIIVDKGEVTLFVNGELVNQATGVAEVPGFIALQSEGAEIHFRNVHLAEIRY
ncbi:MAG: DUF1080 domain-containing protein [Planctomycetaceae bacterium]|jgi:hypothetical protein|nr:DUF1080 domain-containing protein [Planctomycetaceae bacterium]